MANFHAPQLIPGLYAADVLTKSQGDIKTYFVRLQFDGAAPPREFIAAVENAGFAAPPHARIEHASPDVLYVYDFARAGSGLFNAWTQDEAAAFLQELETAFLAHGVPFQPRQAAYYEIT